MSFSIPPSKPGTLEFQVTVAAKNPKTKKWETPTLTEEQQRAIQNAVEEVRNKAEKEGQKVLNRLKEEGVVLELTKSGIYIRKENKWRNILNEIQGPTKSALIKTISQAANFFGKSKTKSQALKTKSNAERLSELGSRTSRPDFVIEVQVVSTEDFFFNSIKKEYEFLQELRDKTDLIREPRILSYIKEKGGLLDEDIARIKKKLETLYDSSVSLYEVLDTVNNKLNERDPQAVSEYSSKMPAAYREFCEKMQDWQTEQLFLEKRVGFDPFQIDTNHPEFQKIVAQQLEVYKPEISLKEITTMHANYEAYRSFIKSSREKVSSLFSNETKFNTHLSKAIEALQDEEYKKFLIQKRFEPDEIQTHLETLQTLKKTSDPLLEDLQDIKDLFEIGNIKEGLGKYRASMETNFSSYAEALSNLAIPQKVAKGRFPGEKWWPFELELNRAPLYRTFLEETLKGVPPEIEKPPYQQTVETMKNMILDLEKTLSFPIFSQHLDGIQKRIENLRRNTQVFTEKFSLHRERFEAMMRAQGYSDLETAFLFNHFVDSFEVIKDFKERFNDVVERSNRKENQEALQAYADLINHQAPRFVESIQRIYLVTERMGDNRITNVLKALTMDPNIRQVMQLQTTNLQTEFEDAVKYAEKIEIGLPENVARARETLTTVLRQTNEYRDREQKIFKESQDFATFFAPLRQERSLLDILQENGWADFREIEKFTKLYNDYAREIQPLKEAELAILSENNPVKKRALQKQLKVLAREKKPEVQKLHTQFRRLGGLQKLKSLQTTAEKLTENKAERKKEVFQKLQESFDKNILQGMAITSVQDMIEKLEPTLNQLPTQNREMMKKSFQNELNLIQEYKFIEGIQLKANFLVDLLQERAGYLDTLFKKHLLIPEHSFNHVKNAKVRNWLEKFQDEYHPLNATMEALKADPGNVLLQQQLKKMWRVHRPKLSYLSTDFKKNIGMRGVKQEDGKLEGIILEMDTKIAEIQKFLAKPMSWDKELISSLTSKKSLLYRVKTQNKTSLWEKLFKEQGLKPENLPSINRLYQSYQTELRKMQELERKLEARPEDSRLRSELFKEIRGKKKKLDNLEKRFLSQADNIAKLQTALGALNKHLREVQTYIQTAEEMVAKAKEKSEMENYEKNIEWARKQETGNLTDKEISSLIDLTSINVLQLFNGEDSLRAFWLETSSRFPVVP